MKKFCLVCLFFSILSPVFAQSLPFSSLQELYQTIKKFSQEDLGMPLDFNIPSEVDSAYLNATTARFYIFMVCHKLRFWSDNTPLCSLYVYGDTIPIPADIILQYNWGEYDVWSSSVSVSSTNLFDKQVVPIIDLNDIDNFVLNLEIIFHEGFHYYAAKSGATATEKQIVTMKNRGLEESAASTVGWLATHLFIEKYCSDCDLAKQIIEEELDWQNEFTNYILDLYQGYNSIYCSNLSDSLKLEARLKMSEIKNPANNASLSYYVLYYRYRPMFKKIWFKNGPKKGIEIILQILKSNTDKLKTVK